MNLKVGGTACLLTFEKLFDDCSIWVYSMQMAVILEYFSVIYTYELFLEGFCPSNFKYEGLQSP